MYRNEKGVGDAISSSGLDRSDVFITSKLNNGFHRPDDARTAFDGTLAALGTDYVDLFLIHWPLPTRYDGDFVSTWQTLIEFQRDGRARSIGVSNFQVDAPREAGPEDPGRARGEPDRGPPLLRQRAGPRLRRGARHRHRGVVPLAQGGVLEDELITAIAEKVGKTPGQVVLRWHIQRGDVVFPKSTTPARIVENIDIFDFELDDDAMASITALDQGEKGRTGPNPDEFDYIPG